MAMYANVDGTSKLLAQTSAEASSSSGGVVTLSTTASKETLSYTFTDDLIQFYIHNPYTIDSSSGKDQFSPVFGFHSNTNKKSYVFSLNTYSESGDDFWNITSEVEDGYTRGFTAYVRYSNGNYNSSYIPAYFTNNVFYYKASYGGGGCTLIWSKIK